MKSRELQKIYHIHRDVLDRYLSEFPVKLGDMAREIGVHAIKIATLPTGVSGQIMKEENHYVIRVNRNEARERQRFTIAHELAHYLLHRQFIDSSPDGITDTVLYRSGASEQIEYEANRLAADLVMPINLIKNKLKEDFHGVVTEATIESLATSFGVSKAAMEIRLSNFSEI
jgi:Zn-dependent peptidase ImmA (M78 family)